MLALFLIAYGPMIVTIGPLLVLHALTP